MSPLRFGGQRYYACLVISVSEHLNETIYHCVLTGCDGGADGIVVSREYEEMTVPSLKVVGRAVRGIEEGGVRCRKADTWT